MLIVCLSAWNLSRSTPDQGTTIMIDLWTTPDRLVMTESLPSTASIKLYTAGCLSHVIGHNSQVDPMSLKSHSRVTFEALMSLLCGSAKVATLDQFQEWLVTDLRTCRVTYESLSDIRPICEGFATDIRASPKLATREKFPDRFEPFHTVGELVPSDGESPELLRVFRSRLRPSDK